MYLSRPGEKLEEHENRVIKNFSILESKKESKTILKNILNKILKENEMQEYYNIVDNLIEDIISMHDYGKRNPYFQAYLGNEEFKNYDYNEVNKQHSIIAAYYFLEKYKFLVDENFKRPLNKNKRELRAAYKKLICISAFIIAKHHGAIDKCNIEELFEKVKNLNIEYEKAFYLGFDKQILEFYENVVYEFTDEFTISIFIKYMFSILVTCDYMAVYEFSNGTEFKLNLIDDIKKREFVERFENNNIVKGIREFSKGNINLNTLNKYRSEMFLESEKNLIKNLDENLFYLEAPTGSGKSITSLNLSLNLINDKYNKIYYIAPFINIIEQTYKDVKSFISNDVKDVALISSKEEIIVSDIIKEFKDEDNKIDDLEELYEKDYMDNLFINYPFSVLSHVKLFDILFSPKRRHALMMSLLSNSVIIIDELQSYRNKLWIPIINFLKKYSDILNIKVIMMSATLPKLDVLLEEKYEIKNLIDRRDYYYEFFKTRVDSDFSLLDRENTLDTLYEKVEEISGIEGKGRILIGTIKTKTCDEIYNYMKRYRDKGFEVYQIKGNTSNVKKQSIIAKLKKFNGNDKLDYVLKKVILVATQCVEAGVDIDMNVGFKNIAIFDADEQFCGRIERNFRNKGEVYFYKVDEQEKVYDEDYRIIRTLEDKECRERFETKEFDKLYEEIYISLKKKEINNYIKLKKLLRELNFIKVYNNMKLITEELKKDLLIKCKYKYKESGEIVDSAELIEEYIKIKEDKKISYAEKQIKLSKFRKAFDPFIYSINLYDIDKVDVIDRISNWNIVENAYGYFDLDEDGCVTEESELNLEALFSNSDIF